MHIDPHIAILVLWSAKWTLEIITAQSWPLLNAECIAHSSEIHTCVSFNKKK